MLFHYAHPEWFNGIEKPKLSLQDKVILWGAGKLGSVVAHTIEKQGFKIKAFVDSATDKQGKTYCGYKIISPDELYQRYSDAVVIVSCAFPIVYDELRKSGKVERVFDPHSFLMEIDFRGYAGGLTVEYASRITTNALHNFALYYGVGLPIERLYFFITEKCSLNCRNCDAYIPFRTNPRMDSFDLIIESYNKMKNVCDYIENIDLFGGEPLIHPEIDKITNYFVEEKSCGKVTIITNGTIVPNDNLVQILKSPKCMIRMSDYGGLSKKKEEIISLCKREKINYEVTNYQYWDKLPPFRHANETAEQLDSKFNACTTNMFYIKNGKLFQCVVLAGLYNLEEQVIPDYEKNYIDLQRENTELLINDIKKYIRQLHERRHLDACKYCPGSHCIHFEDKQPVAEQAQGKLPLELLFKEGKRL